jgi:polyisoprenoid-binding protein YceI
MAIVVASGDARRRRSASRHIRPHQAGFARCRPVSGDNWSVEEFHRHGAEERDGGILFPELVSECHDCDVARRVSTRFLAGGSQSAASKLRHDDRVARRRRRLIWWIAGIVVVVVIAAIGAPFIYIHFIEGPPPAKLTLPQTTTTKPGSTRSSIASSSLDGTWNVGRGSVAGYRVNEDLVGQHTTAVGRTREIWGSLEVSAARVTSAKFTVAMASVKSDQTQRNARFDGPIMDVSRYPTSTFTLTAPTDLIPPPIAGVAKHYMASGTLDLHGVSHAVTLPLQVQVRGSNVDVLADITVPFSEWNIANPSIGGFVTTADQGTLEVLLVLTQGPGNPASTTTGAVGNSGGGGPVTVPSTTVPSLTVPSS